MARRSLKHRPSSEMLSDDLIYELLLLLPVKSLLRFKAVSKQWRSILSDPSFIDSHLAIKSRRDNITLIVHTYKDRQSLSLVHLGSRKLVNDVLKFPYFESELSFVADIRIVGCVKGIVCFSVFTDQNRDVVHIYRSHNTYLWNPATKQSKLIYYNVSNKGVSYGFGYDSTEDDFKVIRIIGWSFGVEVYSAKMNMWRAVVDGHDLSVLHNHPYMSELSICVRGFFLWIGIFKGIIAYDLNKDVLKSGIMFPGRYERASITDLYDSVATIVSNWQLSGNINLWTLDDVECLRAGGVEASWTLMLSIHPDPPPVQFVDSYFTSGDLLLLTNGYKWVLFNSDEKEAKKVPIPTSWRYILKYTESLVSIPGFEQVKLNAHQADN